MRIHNNGGSLMNKHNGRARRPGALNSVAGSLLAALLLAPMVVHAEDPEPPLGINVLEATFKWRPNYVSDDMLIHADKDANNWLHYGKDYQGTRFSQLRQVTQDNVKKLVPKWNLSFGVNDAQVSQTTVVNGRIYVTASQNKVFSLDGSTGRMIWKYERSLPGDLGPRLCCEAVNRGVAVYKDMVYMATLDTHIVALNNTTGRVVWEKKMGDYTSGEIYTSMPLVADGKIVVGNSGGDVGGNVGKITALDPDTGEIIWQTLTRPVDANDPNAKTWANDSWRTGGASAWLTGNYEAKTNTIYWGVGNPSPDFDPSVRKGDNLYSNSTLAMDAKTGKIKYVNMDLEVFARSLVAQMNPNWQAYFIITDPSPFERRLQEILGGFNDSRLVYYDVDMAYRPVVSVFGPSFIFQCVSSLFLSPASAVFLLSHHSSLWLMLGTRRRTT
mgnify:CR=1 FL=1